MRRRRWSRQRLQRVCATVGAGLRLLRGAVVLLVVAALVVVLGTSAMAAPAPIPTGPPGSVYVPATWHCAESGSTSLGTTTAQHDCEVRSWMAQPAPVATSPVLVVNGAGSPVPVAEQGAAQPVGTVSLTASQSDDLERVSTYLPAGTAVLVFLLGALLMVTLRAGS